MHVSNTLVYFTVETLCLCVRGGSYIWRGGAMIRHLPFSGFQFLLNNLTIKNCDKVENSKKLYYIKLNYPIFVFKKYRSM